MPLPGKYGDAIPVPGDVVYRRGSPQSTGVVTATRVMVGRGYKTPDEARAALDAGEVWRHDVQIKVTWVKKTPAGARRVTNIYGPDEWMPSQYIGGCLEQLRDETQRKLDTHNRNIAKAIAWAEDNDLPTPKPDGKVVEL
jgi:hypothetical protein